MSRFFRDEQQLREQICEIGRLMRQYNYAEGTSGNISARLDDEHILATPSGLPKGRMSPDQLIVVDLNGEKVGPCTDANRDLNPTSEILLHLECYQQRPDVHGVVHAHPQTATALTCVGISMEACILPEAVIMLGLVPTAPYAAPCGAGVQDSVCDLIPDHDAIMLCNHGSLTMGADVWTAYLRLEVLEHFANVLYRTHQLGGAKSLPLDEVEKLLSLRRRSGLAHPHDEELFHKWYDSIRYRYDYFRVTAG
jgi:L-fuculose-phosphate aldolase